MRAGLRLMMLRGAGDQGSGGERPAEDYSGGYVGEPAARFRDRDGREHYNNGRFAPMSEGPMWYDGRQAGGGYTSPRSEYPMTPYVPPIYQEDRGMRRGEYQPMGKIGFSVDGEMERIHSEHGGYRRAESPWARGEDFRRGSEQGGGETMGAAPLTKETAQEWARHMENADGTRGPHWTMEQTEEARTKRGIDCDPLKFWLAMNMIYSDYCKVAEKVNANSMDFYVYMAKAFLDDKDADPDKLARYYWSVVRK